MATFKVPIVVSGVKMMRRVFEEISIDPDGCKLTNDYVAGFMDYKKAIMKLLDELERMNEENHHEWKG